MTPTTNSPAPTAKCLPAVELDVHPVRSLHVSFDDATRSADSGLLLLRVVDDKLQLSTRLAALFPDTRDPDLTIHPPLEQIRQVLYQLVLGYEDRNDATMLRHDRLSFLTVCDRLPDDPIGLSSQPTLSRFEHAPTARSVVRIQRTLEQDWYVPARMVYENRGWPNCALFQKVLRTLGATERGASPAIAALPILIAVPQGAPSWDRGSADEKIAATRIRCSGANRSANSKIPCGGAHPTWC